MVIMCINWNKKENTCINKICFQRQKKKEKRKKRLHQLLLSYKRKRKELWLELYLELGLRSFVSCLRRNFLVLFLRCPSHGRIVEVKSFSKLAEAAPSWRASTTLSEEVLLWISASLACSCWLGGGGFWSWASSAGGMTGGAASFWLGTCMAGGKKIFFGLLNSKEASIQLDWGLLPRSKRSRHDIRRGPLPLGHPQSQPRQHHNHATRLHLFPSQLWLWLFLLLP